MTASPPNLSLNTRKAADQLYPNAPKILMGNFNARDCQFGDHMDCSDPVQKAWIWNLAKKGYWSYVEPTSGKWTSVTETGHESLTLFLLMILPPFMRTNITKLSKKRNDFILTLVPGIEALEGQINTELAQIKAKRLEDEALTWETCQNIAEKFATAISTLLVNVAQSAAGVMRF
ncbi:hypothetical protein HDU81_011087 [Chytriomyces hyalinus]|nr:hypothetical protein HDU81_011087 [Chytriomyces hyalinus]